MFARFAIPELKILPMILTSPIRTKLAKLWFATIFPTVFALSLRCFAQPEQGYEHVFPSMGTTVTFAAFSTNPANVEMAFDAAQKEIVRLVAILSDYDDESELSQLNSNMSPGQFIKVSAELWEVLAASDKWHRISGGSFDASVGALTRLWRQHRRRGSIPSDAEIAKTLKVCGWHNVVLDVPNRSVSCLQQGLLIDLGAIAKGYIVDRAFILLQQHGLDKCMVNAGGDLRCGAAPPGRSGWKIGIAPLQASGPPIRIIEIADAAIATSGDLWQYSIIQGKRRSHILDPKSGIGVEGPMSLSAIAPTALEADAAATALSVLGVQRGCELAERIPEIEAMAISLDQPHNAVRYSVTNGFAR